MTLVKGRLADIYICSDAASTAFTNEATTANAAATEFTIADAAKRFVNPAAAVTVRYNGSPTTAYERIQHPGGRVVFATTPGEEAVTITGRYFASSRLAQCREWELSGDVDFVDVTCFGDTARVNLPMLHNATCTVGGFYLDESRQALLTDARLVGLDLFVDASSGAEVRYALFARASSVGTTAAADAAVEQSLSFAVVEGPYVMVGI